jgi:hypothetical protein
MKRLNVIKIAALLVVVLLASEASAALCHRAETGTMTQNGCWGCQAGQSGWIGGDWVLMHRGDSVQLTTGTGSRYYWRRIEIEYWNGSGSIAAPTASVTGTHILAADTQGNMSSKCGTCTGCNVYYQQSYYWLRGTVRWTDNERTNGMNCAYNLGFKLNVAWSEINNQSPRIIRDNGC